MKESEGWAVVRRASPAIFIVAVTWIANFLHFTSFGFYDDDWWYMTPPYSLPSIQWFSMLKFEVAHFYLGRPLQNISVRVFGYIGAVLSSIPILYVLAFLLLAASALLFYRVLRMRFPVSYSTIATLVFVLSPLTTIKQLLILAFTFGPGFILLFLAILLYGRRRALLALLLASATLLTYESLFFVYFAAPFFCRGKFSTQRRKTALIHFAACAGVLVIYFLVRRYFDETRVAAATSNPIDTIRHMVSYWAVFTLSSFKPYLYAVYLGVREAGLESVFYCLVFFLPALALTFRLWPARGERYSNARRQWWLRTAAIGLALTALAYVLAYFHLEHNPVFPLSGRDTRASGAASIGSSIVVAAVLACIGESTRRFWKTSARVLTAVILSLLFLYAFVVQRDYVQQWIAERSFLAQAILLSPDVQKDSYFFVLAGLPLEPLFPRGPRRPSIGFSRHGLQISLPSLFQSDRLPRILFLYSDEWSRFLNLHSDGKLYWTQENFPGAWARSTTDPITPGRIILMREDENGTLTRSDSPLWTGGKQIVQILSPPAGSPLQSNWRFWRRSPLLTKVLPDYALSSMMLNLPDAPTQPAVRIAGGLSAREVIPAGEGGQIDPGPPLKITTAAHSGYFAAAFPIHTPAGSPAARYVFLRARVLSGRIGVGLLDPQTRIVAQKILEPSPQPIDLYMPILPSVQAAHLVIFNAAAGAERSELVVDDAALVSPAQL